MAESKQEMSETRPKVPASLLKFEASLDDFVLEIKRKVLGQAKEKGYITGNEDSGRALYDFIDKYVHNHGHAIGEIVYKAVRFSRRKDPEDIVKVAAWAFLVWDAHRRGISGDLEKLYQISEDEADKIVNAPVMGYTAGPADVGRLSTQESNLNLGPKPDQPKESVHRAHVLGTPCLHCGMTLASHRDGYCESDCSQGKKYEPNFKG